MPVMSRDSATLLVMAILATATIIQINQEIIFVNQWSIAIMTIDKTGKIIIVSLLSDAFFLKFNYLYLNWEDKSMLLKAMFCIYRLKIVVQLPMNLKCCTYLLLEHREHLLYLEYNDEELICFLRSFFVLNK